MHALEVIGLLSKANGQWGLSKLGKEEAKRIRSELPERATKVVETVNRLFDQSRLSALGSTIASVMKNPYFPAITDTAKFILNSATQTSIQSLINSVANIDTFALAREAANPLINAMAGVDLLATTEDTMQSLMDIVGRFDSTTLAQESKHPLLNAMASVELITSAQDTMQTLTGVAARFSSAALDQNAIQPLISAAASFDPLGSAQEAILPLLEATVRFDTLTLSEKTFQTSVTLAIGDHTPSLAEKAIQPLLSAATRFDSITFGQEIMQPLLKTMGGENLQSSFQEQSGILPRLASESIFGASVLEIASSAQLSSAFEAIKSISLKPTIVELAASQAVQVIGDLSHNIVADIYPRLTQEALASFSQSRLISQASIEQVAALGNVGSDILKEFNVANLELSNIIKDFGVITAHDNNKTSWIAMMPNVAEVGRTYKGLLADMVGDLTKSLGDYRMNGGIAIPTISTSAYIRSMKMALVSDEMDEENIVFSNAFPATRRDGMVQLDSVFQSLGTNFTAMWQGSWAVLESNNPDRIRQAAHSGRELLMQTLANLAPDSAFDSNEVEKYGYKGKITRKMRVKKILANDSKSVLGWADSVAKALDETYDRLADMSHDRSIHPRATERQLAGLLYCLGGLISFIDASQNRNTDDR